jgi:hypothetical protein
MNEDVKTQVDIAKAALNSIEWLNRYQTSAELYLAIDKLQQARKIVEESIEL